MAGRKVFHAARRGGAGQLPKSIPQPALPYIIYVSARGFVPLEWSVAWLVGRLWRLTELMVEED